MSSKSDRFYFQNFTDAATQSCNAANYLEECLTNFDSGKIQSMLSAMHKIEHESDEKKHEMSAALAKAFVTPVDREDLALISQNIDEVTDSIEEILQCIYINQITKILPQAHEFSMHLIKCCELMKNLLAEFVNFKKSQKLHQLIIELNHCEEECDKIYLDAVIKIRDNCDDVLSIISWREIYDKMECCADACEHVGDCVETVVMKNT